MGWLIFGLAGILLLLGILQLRRWRHQQRDTFEIPLIVDLAELRASQRDRQTPLPVEPPLHASSDEETAPWEAPARAAAPARQVTRVPVAAPVHAAPPVQVAVLAEAKQPNNGEGTGANGSGRPERKSATMPVMPESMVQMLPGRLEVVEGTGLGQEIRLFRISSLEEPEITFGRSAGPEYRHVQLKLPTVSRLHARIRYQNRSWKIGNLSEINPVALNDQEMAAGEELILEDGDRIRIGEAVFRFRNPQR